VEDLASILSTLRRSEPQLRRLGVRHAAVFGSIARGNATAASDVDVLVDLDPEHPIGVFEYSRLKLYIADLLGSRIDVVNRRSLKPLLRDSILHDCVDAF
jgi:predicted nucleotidyltransferase